MLSILRTLENGYLWMQYLYFFLLASKPVELIITLCNHIMYVKTYTSGFSSPLIWQSDVHNYEEVTFQR